jgi:hypothetical protein
MCVCEEDHIPWFAATVVASDFLARLCASRLVQPGAARLRRLVAVNATFDKLQAAVAAAVAASVNPADGEASDEMGGRGANSGSENINSGGGSGGASGGVLSLAVNGGAEPADADGVTEHAASAALGSLPDVQRAVRELVAMAARFGKFEIVQV